MNKCTNVQILITDGYTLNPGDLSWEPFEKLGEVRYYDRTSPTELEERCSRANIIVTNKTPVTARVVEAAETLQLIAVTATGYNIVNIAAAKKKAIPVCNVPGYGTYSVAQHTFALLLELTNHAGINAASVKQGAWYSSPDWCYTKAPLVELKDKILGIIGMGKIGKQVACIAAAFGMKIIYTGGSQGSAKAESVAMEQLFNTSDFISVHCPLTEGNQSFISKKLLDLVKPSAFLINTSRGQLINEFDLASALQNNKLAGAALDVLSIEPPSPGHPLINLPNCLITPHNAWMSMEARSRIMQATFENIRAMLNGRPRNVVNK